MTHPTIHIPSVATWTFGEARKVSDCLKTFDIHASGKGVAIQLTGCHSQFDASSLNEGTRKTLTLRLPKEWDTLFGDMEEAVMEKALASSEVLFGGAKIPESQLRDSYKAIAKKSGDFPRNVRCKINLAPGTYSTRYWDSERAMVPAPEDHSGMTFNVVLKIRSLWVTPKAWGLVCDACDLQITESPMAAACPFGDQSAARMTHGDVQEFIERRVSSADLLQSHPLV